MTGFGGIVWWLAAQVAELRKGGEETFCARVWPSSQEGLILI